MSDRFTDEKIRQDILDTALAEEEEKKELEKSCPCRDCKGQNNYCYTDCDRYDEWLFKKQMCNKK